MPDALRATNETSSVEEAVHRFLAEDEEDPLAQPIGVAAAWRSLWKSGLDRRLHKLSQRADVAHLEVLELSDDQATVALEAVVHSTWRDERVGSAGTLSLHFVGPVTLRRLENHWRVTDYCVDGRPVSLATTIDPRGVQQQGGVRVIARAVHLSGRGTSLVLAIENGRRADVRVRWCALRVPRRVPPFRRLALLGVGHIPAGTTELIDVNERIVLPLSTAVLHVALLLVDVETHDALPFLFDVGLADTEIAAAPQPAPARMPLTARFGARWHGGTAFLIAMGAIAAYLAVRGAWGLIGLLSLAYGAMIAIQVRRLARRRDQRGMRWLTGGIALMVLGVVLLALFRDDISFV